MKKLFITFTTLFFVGVSAQADILIDPYIGYIASATASNNFTATGSDMGVRLGWTSLGLGLGLDATIAGTHTYKDPTTTTDYTVANTGVFVSYTFPILVRGYATYFVNSKLTTTGSSFSGAATKLGAQYTGFPFIAVGIEVISLSYTEFETGGVKNSVTNSGSQTRLALSVPFNL